MESPNGYFANPVQYLATVGRDGKAVFENNMEVKEICMQNPKKKGGQTLFFGELFNEYEEYYDEVLSVDTKQHIINMEVTPDGIIAISGLNNMANANLPATSSIDYRSFIDKGKIEWYTHDILFRIGVCHGTNDKKRGCRCAA